MRRSSMESDAKSQQYVSDVEKHRLRGVIRVLEGKLSWLAAKDPEAEALSIAVTERLSYVSHSRERFITQAEIIAYGNHLRAQNVVDRVEQKDGIVTFFFTSRAHNWFRNRNNGSKAKPAPAPIAKQKRELKTKAKLVQPPKPISPPVQTSRNKATESARKLIEARQIPPESHIDLPRASSLCWPMLLSVTVRTAKFSTVVEEVAAETGFNRRFITVPVPISTNQTFSLRAGAACDYLVRTGYLKRVGKFLSTTPRGDDLVITGVEPSTWPDFVEPKVKTRNTRMTEQSANTRNAYLSVNMDANRVVRSLPQLETQKILGIWQNAVRILADKKRQDEHPKARVVLDALNIEFDRRSKSGSSDERFPWPTTEAQSGDGSLRLTKSHTEGMLAYLEYHVGRTNGPQSSVRQSILSRVFEGSLPPVFEKAYMEEWGQNGSAARLRKIAESIAAFTRNAKRREDDRLDEAIRQWEQDLKFLYERYYVGKFHFAWPVTTI